MARGYQRVSANERSAINQQKGESKRVDPVGRCIWLVTDSLSAALWLHCLAALLLLLRGLFGVGSWSLGFAPCAAAVCVCAAAQAKVLYRVSTLKMPAAWQQHGGMYGALDADDNLVPDDEMPLVRRGVVSVVAAVPALLLVATSEAFLWARLEFGGPAVATAFAPLLSLIHI